ncbi:polysaccharide deacetylase family protein [Actinoplanes subtropicus]|uniref:polysaccharide deacetylase family protein n=1 Tax=Actinoplanes subtropicus TaxID=543632 RepID=UPI0004C433C7|nr:polysaccharide deacetylase family protein [Actinoplanes subtropicus]
MSPIRIPEVDPRRRQLLRALPAVAATALLAGAAPTRPARLGGATTTPRAAPSPSAAPPAGGGPATTPGHPPAPARPVFTLADYRRAVPGPAFPANAVALTIDDGPHPRWTPPILQLLERYHVPALFCMIGNQVLGHESTARSVVQAGHQVANHSWSHPSRIAHLPPAMAHQEILRAQDKIYSTTGHTPKLFRSPGGAWSPSLARTVADSRVLPLDWSDDPRDWTRPGVAHITNRLLAARPGQILLCHDGGGDRSQTLAALRTVIPALQARGYQFVALDAH